VAGQAEALYEGGGVSTYIRIERAGTAEKRIAKNDRIIAVTPKGEMDISNMVGRWTVSASAKGREVLTLELLAVDIVDAPPDVALLREATS